MDYFHYLSVDKPIPYKELKLIPVVVRDYMDFLWSVGSLLLDKNSIPDIQVISMTYLEYLFHLAENDDAIELGKLMNLLSLVTRLSVDDIGFVKKDGKPYIVIEGKEYNSNDLIKMKEIILLQNDVRDIDETISKELRDELEEAQQLRMQLSKSKPGNFEDDILSFMSVYPGYTLEQIYDLPIRKFQRALTRADHLLHYKIYLSAEMSGMVSFNDKNALKHWMSNLDKEDPFDDVKVNPDEVESKLAIDGK